MAQKVGDELEAERNVLREEQKTGKVTAREGEDRCHDLNKRILAAGDDFQRWSREKDYMDDPSAAV